MAAFNIFLLLLIVKSVTSKSFSIVVDTTESMEDELQFIKNNMPVLVNYLSNRSDFENFIVVPFNDVDVEEPSIASKAGQLLEVINSLTANGGRDCPEDSLAGTQKALEISQHSSKIYVFTDAYAKSNRNFAQIEELCRNTRSQVIIFLSGNCVPGESRTIGDVGVYYDIARVCSGAVFRLDAINLKKAFKYIMEMTRTDYNEVEYHSEYNGYKQVIFTVDTFTTDLLLAVSGQYPVLQIVDSDGNSPYVEKIFDMRQSLVVKLSSIAPGQYHASARCQGPMYITLYKRCQTPFEYGFSPRNPNTLEETARSPLPGWTNYIFIKLRENYNVRVDSLELDFVRDNDRQLYDIVEKIGGAYVASAFIEPTKPFKMAIIGKDLMKYEDIRVSTKVIYPQSQEHNTNWQTPTSEIIAPDSNLVDFEANATVACKVKGYPKPKIWWEDDLDNVLVSEDILLEIPSTYISYATIVNIMSNITLYCKCKNAVSQDVSSIELFVNRTFIFEILQKPEDQSIKYGESGKLYCEVDAYPEADVKWYHNDTLIDNSDNIEIIDEGFALEIKKMTLVEVGTYTCELSNIANRQLLTATISVTGLEMPEVKFNQSEVFLNAGDRVDIECGIEKGYPWPNLHWDFKSEGDDEFKALPSQVLTSRNILRISAAMGGVYRCTASNILGQDADHLTVKIIYAPKITNNGDEMLIVKEGDQVELPCQVDAIPSATVRWEMTRDDYIISLDHRHSTDDEHTHRFYALWKDSGDYHCIAENNAGRAEKTVRINVFVAPYIEPTEFQELNVTAGTSISLPCNLLYGNPAPSIKWDFRSGAATVATLQSCENCGPNNALKLNNISKENEGIYLCVADNVIGNDSIRIHLRVK